MAETENQEGQKKEFFDLNPGTELEQADAEALEEGTSPESHIVSDAPETVEQPKDTPEETTAVTPAAEPTEDDQGRQPTQFEYWQSQADINAKDLRAEREETQRLRQEIADSKQEPQPKEETLTSPVKPNSDDPIDIQAYQGKKIEYQDKIIQDLAQGIQQEKQLREQAETQAQNKAYTLGQLQKSGLNPDDANGALEYYSQAQKTPDEYYKELANFYLFVKGKKSTVRTEQIDNRLDRQKATLPLGVVPAESETPKVDESTAFFQDVNNFNKEYL